MRPILRLFLLSFFLLLSALQVSHAEQQVEQPEGKKGAQPNRLIYSDSPYLLQHAYNPVDWYPWGVEAFEKAKKENKPIFLSIGYSTCHWCHVMARESFENPEIAGILNKYFVAIKVDREQRPDIDAVYMAATELINGYGGWPMSVFLDHRLRPFHAATYYPPYTTESGPGLKDILLKIHQLWISEHALVEENAEQVSMRIGAYADDTGVHESLAENIHVRAMQEIRAAYDSDFGGFSAAPKFPRPGIFAYLNRMAGDGYDGNKRKKAGSDKDSARDMMQTTLDAMAAGGIFDQVGGGFHRYSVDASWQVPHFEKMLYTQALMVMAYSDFYRLAPRDEYRRVVSQTLAFVQREMRSPDGGFYSALDADSERPDRPGEHAEGAYYLWSQAELKKILSAAEFRFAREYFHLREHGNIDADPDGEFENLNILYIDEAFRDSELAPEQQRQLRSVRSKLLKARLQRPPPHLDDKMITAWNAMMIAALARASRVFDRPEWLRQAELGLGFINKKLYRQKETRLLRSYRSGREQAQQGVDAMLEDYAWLIYALLEVYRAGGEVRWLAQAIDLQKQQDALFLDPASGAYFEASDSDASLLFRFKSIYDGALPAANAIALANLRRLAELAADKKEKKLRVQQAARLLGSFAAAVNRYPSGAAMLLSVELSPGGDGLRKQQVHE
ncbi:MAG TPA: thioredoxin domain-containing protein [Gammaproteobacteria bacterium]|nr:thioredoxin domain-containing protein [Gammaproteobacteria bacterium]